MNTKIKTFRGRVEKLDNRVNEFIKDKEIVDIKQSVTDESGYTIQVVIVIYKEEKIK